MKDVKLMKLTLKNFKGVKSFELPADGQDVKVFGANASGKTTLADAFNFLLFGKDSKNSANFAIKTLVKGVAVSKIDHEVEGVLLIDGQPLTLKRVYFENWTKAKNSATDSFKGHETNYFIDGVPSKKSEYATKVDSIVEEDVFKLLTSPTYFNEQMKWQDRRARLIEIAGDVSVEDALAFNKKLKGLPGILKGRTVDDHRKVIAVRRADINKELTIIPARIDEQYSTLPTIDFDIKEVEKELAQVEKLIDENATQINNIRNGSAIIGKQQEIQQVEMDLVAIKRNHETGSMDDIYKLKAKIQEEESNLAIMKRKKGDLEQDNGTAARKILNLESERAGLYERYDATNVKVFTHESECECPTCGQSLPAESVEAARAKAEQSFNLKKSNELEKIKLAGQAINAQIAEIKEACEITSARIDKASPLIDTKEKTIPKLANELKALELSVKDVSESVEYQAKLKEKVKLETEIKALKENAQEAAEGVESEVANLRTKRAELNAKVAQQAQVLAVNKRIVELNEQQRELAAEFEKLGGELFLTEEYIRSKVELLTEKINSKFKYARFELFKTNINGSLEEICETVFDGVPYGSGLNNAARINVGIDICNTLQKHYGIKVPIWIDNRESVVDLLEADTQMISLIVSEKDKVLRLEVGE